MAKAFLSKYLHSLIDHTGIPGVGGGGDFVPLSGGTITGSLEITGSLSAANGPYLYESTASAMYWEVPTGYAFGFGSVSTYVEVPKANDRITFNLPNAGVAVELIEVDSNNAYLNNPSSGFTDIGTSAAPFGSGYFSDISASNFHGITAEPPSAWADYEAGADISAAGNSLLSATDIVLSGNLSGASSISGTEVSGISGYFSNISAGSLVGISLDYLPLSGGTVTGTARFDSDLEFTSAWTTNVDASGSMVFSYNG